MPKGLLMMLKAFGVNITPAQAEEIEKLIPQIPTKANQLIEFNVKWIQNFDNRLVAIEKRLEDLSNGNGSNSNNTGPARITAGDDTTHGAD